MAATIQIHEMSASLTGTDKTSSTVRFKLADNATIDSNNPVTIPTSGTTRSYQKTLRLYCSATPDTQVDNLKMYTDGGSFAASVEGAASNIGASMPDNAATNMANEASLFAVVLGTPLDMDNTHATACTTATGYFGDMAKVQLVVYVGASSGELTNETLTFSYDWLISRIILQSIIDNGVNCWDIPFGDNQQRSLESNFLERSTTNAQLLPLSGESNGNTSALHPTGMMI